MDFNFIRNKKLVRYLFFREKPKNFPSLHLIGSAFQLEVWKILLTIPYGETTTYAAIAKKIADQRHINKMSNQAVGSAIGHNNISIIVPCHRVIGKNGNLTGYAAGIDTKLKLLQIEKIDTSKMYYK